MTKVDELIESLTYLAEDADDEHAECEHRFADGVRASIQEVASWRDNQPAIQIHVEGNVTADDVRRAIGSIDLRRL